MLSSRVYLCSFSNLLEAFSASFFGRSFQNSSKLLFCKQDIRSLSDDFFGIFSDGLYSELCEVIPHDSRSKQFRANEYFVPRAPQPLSLHGLKAQKNA